MDGEDAKGSGPAVLHKVCAAIGVVAFSIPALGLAVALFVRVAIIATALAALALARFGVLDAPRFDVVLRLGIAAATVLAVSCTVAKARRALRKSQSATPWLANHPWSTATAVLVLIAGGLAWPAAQAGPDSHSAFAGAAVVAMCLWGMAVAGGALSRLLLGTVRTAWSASRRSAFAAGICFAGGLGCLAVAVPVVTNATRRPAPAIRSEPGCLSGMEECLRLTLEESKETLSIASAAALPSLAAAEPEEAFRKCIEKIYEHEDLPGARQLATRILGKDEEVDDLLHETVMTVCQRFPDHPWNYFVTSVRNRALSYLKSPVRRPDLSCPLDDDLPVASCLRQPDVTAADWEVLRRVRCKLSEEHWQAIELQAAGWKSEEVAEHFGGTAEGARKRLERARQGFRKEYERFCK